MERKIQNPRIQYSVISVLIKITRDLILFQGERSFALRRDQAHLKAHGSTDLVQQKKTSYGALSEQNYSKSISQHIVLTLFFFYVFT